MLQKDEMKENIKRLYEASCEFSKYADGANVYPHNILSGYCQTRAIIAARDMALLSKQIHAEFEAKTETI